MTIAKIALLSAALTLQAFAANIQPGDFIHPVVTTFDGLSFPGDSGDAAFAVNLPYTINGNTFSSTEQTTFYYGNLGGLGDCYANECIGSSSVQGELTITFGAPVIRAGFYLGVSAATVTFFSPTNAVLDMETVTPPENEPSNIFIGWSDTAIGGISITGLATNHNFAVDNLTTDAAPEPGTIGFMCVGAVALALSRRSRR